MRRKYTPPPTYGGSRFIRATHGMRALEDRELTSNAGDASFARDLGGQKPMPDFEYFTNEVSTTNSTSLIESAPSHDDQRRVKDDIARIAPSESGEAKERDREVTDDRETTNKSREKAHGTPLDLSAQDGDLLLLILLALLASEEGCAELVVTLAILLMIR